MKYFIEVVLKYFKISMKFFNRGPISKWNISSCIVTILRSNNCKLVENFSRYDMRQHFFTQKIINIWNSLPSHVVPSGSVNIFKNNLDKYHKFWSDQELYYLAKCYFP